MLRPSFASALKTRSTCQYNHSNSIKLQRVRPHSSCKATDKETGSTGGSKDEESIESLLKKEIEKRKASSSVDFSNPSEPFSRENEQKRSSPRSAPRMATPPMEDQRQKSMSLVNEGLEGLIPRATELLKLGGSFFLAFLPAMVIISVLFTGIYFVAGDNFVHGGRQGSTPAYIDPEKLLSAPTVDPYIPF